VAKALRVLRLGGAGGVLPQKGDKLFKDEKEAGYVTSVEASPKLGVNVALGYVRKEVNQIGTELEVRAANGTVPATIVGLPFSAEQLASA
jgi:glycine cleavage system aminomethyltransferase T